MPEKVSMGEEELNIKYRLRGIGASRSMEEEGMVGVLNMG